VGFLLTIAIIDDDTSHCRAVSRLLRASGMQTIIFSSAEAYLARDAGTPADCLVLDIQLGGMSGFDLQNRLASDPTAPPVVFLSAHSEPETIARITSTGCSYVRKTDPGPVLLEAIRMAIASRNASPDRENNGTH